MFKKALQIATTLGLLVAGYAGYTRAFGAATAWVRANTPRSEVLVDLDAHVPGLGEKNAVELAEELFGPDHWTVKDTAVKYYNTERGYWMFFEDYERLNEGKRVTFKPFAVISQSKDGRAFKTVHADKATVDFDQPFDFVQKGPDPLRVVHGRLEGSVLLRDDKGTTLDDADDLTIGPMAYVEFDDPSHSIYSDSEVVLHDRNMQVTGSGLRIDLRVAPGAKTSGFAGAKTLRLLRDVHIVSTNAGSTGILPGTSEGPAKDGATPAGSTPIDLRCAGEMRVVLPDPPAPVPAGQPKPAPAPTLAWFNRGVRVVRGTDQPAELTCDLLFLTLVPTPKAPPQVIAAAGTVATVTPTGTTIAPAPSQADAPARDDGPLTELTLRRAEATGHAVWLKSRTASKATFAKGNQLIHEKLAPAEPDKTYLRADAGTKLFLQQVEYDVKGTDPTRVKQIDTIRTTDVTSFENDKGDGPSSVVARGPGQLESRATEGGKVERSAAWQDQLVMRTEGEGEDARRVITLTGSPEIADPTRGTLSSRTSILASLVPKPKPKPKSTAGDTAGPAPSSAPTMESGDSSYQIEWMRAFDDVELVQVPNPDRPDDGPRHMTARDRLDIEFLNPEPVVTATPAPTTPNPEPAPTTTVAEAATPAEPAPPEPAVNIKADWVWAQVELKSGGAGAGTGAGQGDVKEVRLRGNVDFRQDPTEGKTRGTEARGESADLLGAGEGLAKLRIHGGPDRLAEVANDEFEIQGPKIGLDQAADFAWVEGAGKLTQMVVKGMLNEEGLDDGTTKVASGEKANDKDRAKAEVEVERPKVPMTITWKTDMWFQGRPLDPQGRSTLPGRAEFHGDAVATSEDSYVSCDTLTTLMDRPVPFTKVRRDPAERPDPGAKADPKPQIAWVRCESSAPRKVQVVNLKRSPDGKLVLEKQQIDGQVVEYEKLTGRFLVPGPGDVRLYAQQGQSQGQGGGLLPGGDGRSRQVIPTANRSTPAPPAGASAPKAKTKAQPNPNAKAKAKAPAVPPLEMTRIHFSRGMLGRFGSSGDSPKATSKAAARQADFQGDIQVLHGLVADERTDLDPDRPPTEYVYLTSEYLRVVSEPGPTPDAPSRSYLNALYEAQASNSDRRGVESTIQGDQITYDSSKKLFYVYGHNGRGVSITRATAPGQPPTSGHGQSASFNLASSTWQLSAPREFSLVDDASGARIWDAKPIDPNANTPKAPDRGMRLPSRSDKERRGFNGR